MIPMYELCTHWWLVGVTAVVAQKFWEIAGTYRSFCSKMSGVDNHRGGDTQALLVSKLFF